MVFTVGTGRLIPTWKICQVLDLGSQGSAQVRSDLYQLAFPTGSSLLGGHLGRGSSGVSTVLLIPCREPRQGYGYRQSSVPLSCPCVPFILTPAWWPCHLLDEAQLLSLELQGLLDEAYATWAARSAIIPAHPAHSACGVLAMCLLRD